LLASLNTMWEEGMRDSSVPFFDRLLNSVRIRYSRYVQENDYSPAFRNAKVAVIGPNCQLDARDRTHIAAADVVVVMNKGRRLRIYPELVALARRIAYFHCLDLSEIWGGGPLDTVELRKSGFKAVFYPLDDDLLSRNVHEFHANNRGWLKLRRIAPEVYQDIQTSIGGFRPTSGLAIASSLARIPGCTLYVSGITFYRKAYMPEYAAHLMDLASIKEQMELHGVHHPDQEFIAFMRLKEQYNIQVDEQLEAIIKAPYTPLFYTNPGDDRIVYP